MLTILDFLIFNSDLVEMLVNDKGIKNGNLLHLKYRINVCQNLWKLIASKMARKLWF